jgi:cytosine/adenosine deaminase-related metal-dependent hydrolase
MARASGCLIDVVVFGWHPIRFPALFVINLGDMMRRWTDDLYQSTLHRVLNNVSGRDRRVAFDMVASEPASILGLGSNWGIHEGARADLLITDADDPEDLVASGATKRAVLVGGRVVAGTL